MTASEIRTQARKCLEGKWGKAALLTLSFIAILWIISFIIGIVNKIPFLSILINIAWLVISTPISYGLLAVFIKLKRSNNQIGYIDFLKIAFANIGNVWKVIGNILLKILPLIIGIIVGIFILSFGIASLVFTTSYAFLILIGLIIYIICLILLIPKSFSYALSYLILFDNPDMTGKEIVEKSIQLMQNNRWKLFCLYLSFIGWALLCVLTLGIGYLWLIPYTIIALIEFYDTLTKENNENIDNTLSTNLSENINEPN